MQTRYSSYDTYIQVLIIPVFIGIINSILLNQAYWSTWRVFVVATVVLGVISLCNWLVNNRMGLYLNRRLPALSQISIRLTVLLIWCICTGFSCIFLTYSIYKWLYNDWLLIPTGRLVGALIADFLSVSVIIVMYEGIRAFERWKRTLRETEELKKANLQSQFEGLKSQINPHFLFNSLNTLSSLIEEDPEQAEEFVEEMASVYRYLLRANETPMASLADELAFAQSYFHLLKTRYGANIQLEQSVDKKLTDRLLPPLTLQLLLENAVKHNVILPEQPLKISIRATADGLLIVRNNLQRKNTRVLSNQIGLANIATQFRLLGEGNLRVDDDDQFFTVTLPLIRPERAISPSIS